MHLELSIMRQDILSYQSTKSGLCDSAQLSNGSRKKETGLSRAEGNIACVRKKLTCPWLLIHHTLEPSKDSTAWYKETIQSWQLWPPIFCLGVPLNNRAEWKLAQETCKRAWPSADLSTAIPVSYYSAPCYQATSPVKLFAMDSSPKEATVSEWSLVGTLIQGQWSRDHKEESEVRILFPSSPQGAPVHPASGQRWSGGPWDMWGRVSCWPPEPSLWPPLAGPRPWGDSAPLHASATSRQHHLPRMPSAGPASTPPTL